MAHLGDNLTYFPFSFQMLSGQTILWQDSAAPVRV